MENRLNKIRPIQIRHVVFDHDGTLVDVMKTKALYPGIEELLDNLCRQGLSLYVWTARTRFSTVEFLKSLGIINRFDQLHCSTDGETKPSTEGLSEMLENVDPATVLVVGDSFADMLGAKNFGAYALGAVWASEELKESGGQTRHGESLLDSGADSLAFSVRECESKILEMISK